MLFRSRIVVVTLGNVVGGLFLPLVEKWKARLDAEETSSVSS